MNTTGAHLAEDPEVHKGITTKVGGVTRQFTFCCGVCLEYQTITANNIDLAMKAMSDNEWKLIPQSGWVHRKCCKNMPCQIKL